MQGWINLKTLLLFCQRVDIKHVLFFDIAELVRSRWCIVSFIACMLAGCLVYVTSQLSVEDREMLSKLNMPWLSPLSLALYHMEPQNHHLQWLLPSYNTYRYCGSGKFYLVCESVLPLVIVADLCCNYIVIIFFLFGLNIQYLFFHYTLCSSKYGSADMC